VMATRAPWAAPEASETSAESVCRYRAASEPVRALEPGPGDIAGFAADARSGTVTGQLLALQRTAGNRAVAAMLLARRARGNARPSRIQRDPAETGETSPGGEQPSGPAAGSAASETAEGQPPLGETVGLPRMDDVVASPRVQTARQTDWAACQKDYQERGAWIRWQGSSPHASGSPRDDVHATYEIVPWPTLTGAPDDEPNPDPRDMVDPGSPPPNDSLSFNVGHYHHHPPLDPSQHRDPTKFPVGPSPVDDRLADSLGSPGVVRDFTDTNRTAVRDYRYGPDAQTSR
jgi:hypothetical protein